MEVYSSKLLTVERWNELDGFEGSAYRRSLSPNGCQMVSDWFQQSNADAAS